MTGCCDRGRRRAARIACIFGLIGIAGGAAGAGAVPQTPCVSLGSPGDELEFHLFHMDAPAGEETFAIEGPADSSGGFTIRARGSIHLAGRVFSMTQRLVADAGTDALRDYDLEVTGATGERQSIRATCRADSVVVSIAASGANYRRAFPTGPGPVFVLDNLIASHVALLACRIAGDGFRPETLKVVVPQVGALLNAAIVPQPPAADGTRKVEMRIASVTEILSFNAAGRFDRVDVPSQGLSYQRMVPGYDVPPEGGAPRKGKMPGEGAAAPEAARIPDSGAPPGRQIFFEETIQFVSKKTTLDGVLTLPMAGQSIPYPAVILIAGSGPQDRDATIGPNRPFRDIARGLAVYGVASLRFDKRTLAAPQTIDPRTLTVKEEVIDDAVAAIDCLRSRTEIDGSRISIVGHDLGGALAATIARADGAIAGLVILAGTLADDRVIPGVTPHYLRDYNARDLAGDFLAFRGPVLILFTGKDDQVTSRDLDLWNETAAKGGKKNVTVRTYPQLGHLFIPIQGEPAPATMMRPGSVDPAVIEDISRFASAATKGDGK